MQLGFEWDDEKAKANFKKHRVGFDEASTVFTDPFSVTIPDPGHSADEQRYVDIGNSDKGRVLDIRIISCRKATPSERTLYEKSND